MSVCNFLTFETYKIQNLGKKHQVNFSSINEAKSFPDDWQELPQWQLLSLMGFRIDSISPNGTVRVSSPYLEGSMRLTPAGYVRTSDIGYVFQSFKQNPISDLLNYLIKRFIKKGISNIPQDQLDSFLINNPDLLKFLDFLPQVKKEVLQRTGLSDPRGELHSRFGLSPSTVRWLDSCAKENWKLNLETREIDVNGNFSCKSKSQLGFRGLKFGKVKGNFSISEQGLTSLEGAPREVGGDFDCSRNKLTSLEGVPKKLTKKFICSDNNLTSLKGAPQEVREDFWCTNNQLTSLEGAPQRVGGGFWCYRNQLTSLVGGPQEVKGDFDCSVNKLSSLAGAPVKVGRTFNCFGNQLTSLVGAPEQAPWSFNCSLNQLTSLVGSPQLVVGSFDCSRNELTSLEGGPQKVERFFSCRSNQLTSLKGLPEISRDRIDFGENPPLYYLLSLERIYQIVSSYYDDPLSAIV